MLSLITATKQIQSNQNKNVPFNSIMKNSVNEVLKAKLLKRDLDCSINDDNFNFDSNEMPPVLKTLNRSVGKKTQYIFSKSKLFDGISFGETKHKEILYEKYRTNALMQMIFTIISIVSGLIAVEIEKLYSNGVIKNTTRNYNTIIIGFYFSFISSIGLWMLIISDYVYFYSMQNQQIKISEEILRSQPKAVVELVLTFLVYISHPSPFLNEFKYTLKNDKFDIYLTYTWNSILLAIMMCRLWYPIKFYLINSEYYRPRSKRICEMNKVENNLFFTLKASMQGSAFEIYGLLFLLGIIFFTVTIRIFEMELDSVANCKFSNYWDTVWMVIITMLTVGYGDFFPSTIEGRGLAILAAVIGVILISMLIVSITNMISFTYNEKVVFELIERLQLKDEKDAYAAKLVSQYCKLFKVMKSNPEDETLKEKLREKFLMSLCSYKEKNKEILASYPPMSNYEIINTDLDGIESSLAANSAEYDKILKNLEELNKLF